jgi:hypothetical protein
MTKIVAKRLTRTIPPESGPMPQGLNLNYNGVKEVELTEKINNGRYRQSTSKRSQKRNRTTG